jgi:hypothetical protein
MKLLLFIALIVSASFSFAQVNNQNENSVPATNNSGVINSNNSNGNGFNLSVPANSLSVPASVEDENQLDTLQFEELKIQSSSKKYKSLETKQEKAVIVKDQNQLSSQSQKVSQSAVSFTLTKQQSSTQRTQRSPSIQQQTQMNQVVDDLEQNAPESFEYHYFKYVAGNYNVSLVDDLKKAESLRPQNSDVQIQLAAYHIIMNDAKNAQVYLDKLIKSTRLSQEALDYAEDLLKSAPDNGTLITHGFDDSYACYYLQTTKKIRTDVRLISLDFLQSEKYRTDLKTAAYILPEKVLIDVDYLKEFCQKNESKGLAISMTTPKEYFLPIQQNLFAVALVFEYHKELIYNNFYRNDYLWNEELSKTLINKATTDKAKQLSANYLPMLLFLHKTYTESKEMEKVKEVDQAMDKVAVQCKKYDQVKKIKGSY